MTNRTLKPPFRLTWMREGEWQIVDENGTFLRDEDGEIVRFDEKLRALGWLERVRENKQ